MVPAEITRLPVSPAIFEVNRELELLSVDLKSIIWSTENPLKSRVSLPLPSAMVKAVDPIQSVNSEKILLVDDEILVLNP